MSLLEEEGRFIAKVTAADLGEAKKTGTPFMQLGFETEEGHVSGRLYLSEKAFDRSLKVLQECFGFDGDFENLDPIVGQECSITTEFESWVNDEGETKQSLRVRWINPKGGPQMEAGARQSLAARLSARAGGTAPAPEVESFESDDDNPF